MNSGARFDLDGGRNMYWSLLDALHFGGVPVKIEVWSRGPRAHAEPKCGGAGRSLALACTRSHRQGQVIRQSSLCSEDASSHGEVANEFTISLDDYEPDFAQMGHDANTFRLHGL